MASLFRNNTSPYWWLKWRNPATGKVERFSTECRIGNGAEQTRAVQIRNEHAVKESAVASAIRRHPFAAWVPDYLAGQHAQVPKTLARYQSSWRLLATYLHSLDIVSPAQVRRETCLGYLLWRKKVPHLNGKKVVCRNTILLEIKTLNKILHEAVAREYIPFNPCVRLGLKRDPARPKEEITDAQFKIIRAAIDARVRTALTPEEKKNANFFQQSFEVARLQGIRLNETHISFDDIHLAAGTMLIRGKGNKLEEVNINPNLIPRLKRLKAAGHTHTYEQPQKPSRQWFKFFDRLRRNHPGFKNVSFHSTRVTVISRMERAGVPENVMMKQVLHSSTTIHRVYRKVKPSELAPYWKSLGPACDDKHDTPETSG